jgi:hypothetical protein
VNLILERNLLSHCGNDDAQCLLADDQDGHNFGKVLNQIKITGRKAAPFYYYDVSWEYTGRRISSISSTYLLEACHIGLQIYNLRKQPAANDAMAEEHSTDENFDLVPQSKNTRHSVRTRGWPRGSSRISRLQRHLQAMSDEDIYGAAPDSNNSSAEDEESTDGDV